MSCLGSILREHDGIMLWGPKHKCKKVVMISGRFRENIASFKHVLLEAADLCIAIDFIEITHEDVNQSYMESSSSHELNSVPDLAINIDEFENCTFQQVAWDPWMFASLEKKWVQDMVNDVEGPMEVTLLFRERLHKDRDRVFCSFIPMLIQLADTIEPCQACRCHGAVLDPAKREESESMKAFCPITGQELDTHDFTSNGIKIGSQTVLYLPSFQSPLEPRKFHSDPRLSFTFTILKAIALATLSEGWVYVLRSRFCS